MYYGADTKFPGDEARETWQEGNKTDSMQIDCAGSNFLKLSDVNRFYRLGEREDVKLSLKLYTQSYTPRKKMAKIESCSNF